MKMGDNRDIEEKRDALKQAIQIIDKLTWGVLVVVKEILRLLFLTSDV
ncbi:phage protein [Staphylococcus aureus]|nr:phage protein [Staphylococcus aureus]